jgi:tRNA threonylcarbamoyladenosine biosynthesis protein TsaB
LPQGIFKLEDLLKLLAIETSTMTGGIAIMDGENFIAESRLNVRVTHSERLMKEIDHILRQAGMGIDDIDVFAVSIGPGSFTGLRVGLSTVKGFVYGSDKKVVSVSTLEALAYSLPFCKYPICPMLDARKKEVYAAIFKWEDDCLIKIMEEQTTKIDSLVTNISEITVFLGNGAILYREALKRLIKDRALFAPPQNLYPSPASVAYLAMMKVKSGQYDDPVTLIPRYMRRSEAEIKFQDR